MKVEANGDKCEGPVDTRRRFNVYKTSIRRRRRRIDVLKTLKRRRVSTGNLCLFHSIDW